MSVESIHPEYDRYAEEWVKARDTYEGETEVKRKTTVYLPATDSMMMDGMNTGELGAQRYQAYLTRAVFPDFVNEATDKMVSAMNQKEPSIELPASMEYLRENATVHGESLVSLLRRINFEQLLVGRVGLLPDFENETVQPQPRLAVYNAETIRNWYAPSLKPLQFVVLDESSDQVDPTTFEWDLQSKYRVLALREGRYSAAVAEESDEVAEGDFRDLSIRGKRLEYIPFTFINAADLTAAPGSIPMIGLARLSLTIYRGEADYRQHLFMQGQDTLVIKGQIEDDSDDDSVRVGARSVIPLEPDGDAKYIGVNGQGLAEQRNSLENDRKQAESKTITFSASAMNDAQSGEALKTRIAAQTVSLVQIVQTGAGGMQKALRDIAEWMGESRESVVVTPHTDFKAIDFNSAELKELMTSKNMGAPISEQSIHGLLVEKGFTKLTFDQEKELIDNELGGLPSDNELGGLFE